DPSAILRPEPGTSAAGTSAAGPERDGDPLRELPAGVRNTLRAAATMGDLFESEVVATLLGCSETEVLVQLQQAADAGLALEDRGHGRFRLERELGSGIRKHTLPSLSRAWHQKLAQIFGGPPAPDKPAAQQASATREAALQAAPRAAAPPA